MPDRGATRPWSDLSILSTTVLRWDNSKQCWLVGPNPNPVLVLVQMIWGGYSEQCEPWSLVCFRRTLDLALSRGGARKNPTIGSDRMMTCQNFFVGRLSSCHWDKKWATWFRLRYDTSADRMAFWETMSSSPKTIWRGQKSASSTNGLLRRRWKSESNPNQHGVCSVHWWFPDSYEEIFGKGSIVSLHFGNSKI